jgi:hypothetical protein
MGLHGRDWRGNRGDQQWVNPDRCRGNTGVIHFATLWEGQGCDMAPVDRQALIRTKILQIIQPSPVQERRTPCTPGLYSI